MKNFVTRKWDVVLAFGLVVFFVACGSAEQPVPIEPPNPEEDDVVQYLTNLLSNLWLYVEGYWKIVVPVLWMVVRLTPTKKDNDILAMILRWVDFLVPNKKKGGGVHEANK